MKNSKKVIALSVLLTIGAASSVTTSIQAEGFLSKLMGGKSSADLSSMLTHVPADTNFMFANKEAIPSKVINFHIKRMQKSISIYTSLGKSTEEKEANKDPSKAEAFFMAIADDLGGKLNNNKLEDSGLSLKAHSLIYGYQLTPIIRIGISDKDKILATIKAAEEKTGYKVALEKCGKFDCFKQPDAKGDMTLAGVLLEDHLALSVFAKEKQADIIKHLIGEADPKEAFKMKQWDAFLTDNGYQGLGDGFLKLQKFYQLGRPLLAMGMQQDPKVEMSEKDIEACLAVVDEHIENIPEAVFGTKALQEKSMDFEMVWKTSSAVSDALQTIANPSNIAKRSEKPILDIGFNINVLKLRDALTQYSEFLLKSGKAHKCKKIDEKEVRKAMGGLMMVMNMGLSQFKSVYLSVNNVEMDESMQPKNLEALLSLGTDDPAGLLGMVSMMSPQLQGFKVPEDGTAVKLPEGAVPAKGMPLPPLFISRGKSNINIMVGNDKPVLKDYKGTKPEILSIAVDGKRYYQIITNIMKNMPNQATAKSVVGKDDVVNMMTDMGEMMGNMRENFSADKRGLVIDYHVDYE